VPAFAQTAGGTQNSGPQGTGNWLAAKPEGNGNFVAGKPEGSGNFVAGATYHELHVSLEEMKRNRRATARLLAQVEADNDALPYGMI